MAFIASPSSQQQHCTDEAQKAETVLSAVGYVYLYIYIYIYIYIFIYLFIYLYLLNSQPRIMHFAYSDWFTQSWLSAHIP